MVRAIRSRLSGLLTEVQDLSYVTPPSRTGGRTPESRLDYYAEQRERVEEAWTKVVTPGLLQELIESMPARMQAVIDVEEKFIKY